MPVPIPTPIMGAMTKPADQPAEPGPYSYTTTTTFKSSPLEITITTKHESSHVPPPAAPCGGCGGDGASISPEIVMAIAKQLFDAFKRVQGDDSPPLDMND